MGGKSVTGTRVKPTRKPVALSSSKIAPNNIRAAESEDAGVVLNDNLEPTQKLSEPVLNEVKVAVEHELVASINEDGQKYIETLSLKPTDNDTWASKEMKNYIDDDPESGRVKIPITDRSVLELKSPQESIIHSDKIKKAMLPMINMPHEEVLGTIDQLRKDSGEGGLVNAPAGLREKLSSLFDGQPVTEYIYHTVASDRPLETDEDFQASMANSISQLKARHSKEFAELEKLGLKDYEAAVIYDYTGTESGETNETTQHITQKLISFLQAKSSGNPERIKKELQNLKDTRETVSTRTGSSVKLSKTETLFVRKKIQALIEGIARIRTGKPITLTRGSDARPETKEQMQEGGIMVLDKFNSSSRSENKAGWWDKDTQIVYTTDKAADISSISRHVSEKEYLVPPGVAFYGDIVLRDAPVAYSEYGSSHKSLIYAGRQINADGTKANVDKKSPALIPQEYGQNKQSGVDYLQAEAPFIGGLPSNIKEEAISNIPEAKRFINPKNQVNLSETSPLNYNNAIGWEIDGQEIEAAGVIPPNYKIRKDNAGNVYFLENGIAHGYKARYNEIIATQIYKQLGVDVPELSYETTEDKEIGVNASNKTIQQVIISKIKDAKDLKTIYTKNSDKMDPNTGVAEVTFPDLSKETANKLLDTVVFDAFLGNYENPARRIAIDKNGNPIRINSVNTFNGHPEALVDPSANIWLSGLMHTVGIKTLNEIKPSLVAQMAKLTKLYQDSHGFSDLFFDAPAGVEAVDSQKTIRRLRANYQTLLKWQKGFKEDTVNLIMSENIDEDTTTTD